jgi:AP2-like factor (euAP2 lineage)
LWSAAWEDGELDLELSLGCAGGSDPSTVAVEAFSSAPGSKQRTMTLTVCTVHTWPTR